MGHTLTIRLRDDLADWLKKTSKRTGMSQGQILRAQLEESRRKGGRGMLFMRLAGFVRLEKDLSSRKGFSGCK